MSKTWECWTLSIEDIEKIAKETGRDIKEFSEEDLNEIARKFKKGIEWSVYDAWEGILKEAIEDVV